LSVQACNMYLVAGITLSGTLPERVVAALVLACLLLSPPAQPPRSRASADNANADVIGPSIIHPEKWSVERERYTFDGTYGFV
jgi:hypothetical protein